MLVLRNLILLPSFYRDRIQKVKSVRLSNIVFQQQDEGILISCNANDKYTCNLFLFGKKININSKIKVNCDCESFKYEFAYTLNKHNALLDNEMFIKYITKPPRKKNRYLIPTACKHIIALSHDIFKRKHMYEVKEKK